MRSSIVVRIASFVLILAAFSMPLGGEEASSEVDAVRAPRHALSFAYLPSFGTSEPKDLPFHDSMNADLGLYNLFPTGTNWNVNLGFAHKTHLTPLLSLSGDYSNESVSVNAESAYAKSNVSFAKFFQNWSEFSYEQSRTVRPNSTTSDYDYDKVTVSTALAFDLRRSSGEPWVQGGVLHYPQSGWMMSLGSAISRAQSWNSTSVTNYATVDSSFQALIPVTELATLSLQVQGESALASSLQRPYKLLSRVIGSFPVPGDYQSDVRIEARFLWPQGLYWETPELFYLNTFGLKFSPGFVVGYDVGVSGNFGSNPQWLQSVYVSPLVALRVDGSLSAVLRMDLSYANSRYSSVTIGIGLGSANEKSQSVWKSRF